jgi:hypothetical protein
MESPPVVDAYLDYADGLSGDGDKARTMIKELNRRSLHGYVDPYY